MKIKAYQLVDALNALLEPVKYDSSKSLTPIELKFSGESVENLQAVDILSLEATYTYENGNIRTITAELSSHSDCKDVRVTNTLTSKIGEP